MATANVSALEKTAGAGYAGQDIGMPNETTANMGLDEKTKDGHVVMHTSDDKHSDVESVQSSQPGGVLKMEAVTMVWTKNWLIAAYVSIMLISFVNSLQQQSNWSWTPYVTSSFMLHGLTGITGIVANIIGGVSKLPLAKFIDIVGRTEGYVVCTTCVVLSLVLMASCQNVQTYCAAQVFYWSGLNGIDYIFSVFIADTSLLENRMIWNAFQATPYIVNTFAGPELGQRFLDDSTFRWGYGAFTIITLAVSIPFWAVFFLMERRAKQTGVLQKRERSGRTFLQNVLHWAIEFDVIGLLLVCGGFSIFLLPFSLSAYQAKGWGSSLVICMLIFGFLLIILFGVWERFFAPKTFFPFHLMTDRSVIAACMLGCNTWIAFYSFKMYYSSYLQVVFGLSVAKAGYITNIFNIVSCTWGVIISYIFKYTDTYKWGAVVAMPIQILLTGLLIHFRAPGTKIGLLVMTEVFTAMTGAMFVQIEYVAVMAAVPHKHIASGLALLSMITSVGGSVGQTISSAIWTHTVPKKILEYLPEASKAQAATLYGSLPAVLLLEPHSEEKLAVIRAYADAQRYMVIVGTVALVPCFFWVAMLKNYRMSERGQRGGLQA